ncbi:hypothetical protein SCLARK_001066 [Spiroplasma clarkii]|nr:hypothetical protein SCLARK_001066 [Spiroplasma clarkii]
MKKNVFFRKSDIIYLGGIINEKSKKILVVFLTMIVLIATALTFLNNSQKNAAYAASKINQAYFN